MPGYDREILVRDTNGCLGYEVVMITWYPGSQTSPHDHGACKGIVVQGMVLVLNGTCYEQRKGPGGIIERKDYSRGESFCLDHSTIHVVGNDSAFPAVLLHSYVYIDAIPDMASHMTVLEGW
jgi:predicted metal-dependent enzyme (double-stranded beta helix superfamily)